jgi:hypothetical protein
MRVSSLRNCLAGTGALLALMFVGPASAQAVTCGDTFAPIGNISVVVGQPVGYDVGSATRTMDATMLWGDGTTDGSPGLQPGQHYHFSHSYTVPGTYEILLYVDSSDPVQSVCHDSFDLATVSVSNSAPVSVPNPSPVSDPALPPVPVATPPAPNATEPAPPANPSAGQHMIVTGLKVTKPAQAQFRVCGAVGALTVVVRESTHRIRTHDVRTATHRFTFGAPDAACHTYSAKWVLESGLRKPGVYTVVVGVTDQSGAFGARASRLRLPGLLR